MSQVTPITETLQAATYDQNVRIGELPFFEAVNARQLSTVSYVTLLRSLATIYDAFEQVVVQTTDYALRTIWGRDLHKQLLLQQDIATLAGTQIPAVPAAALGAEVLAEHIRLRATLDPRSLLGSAYALATWNMGGAALCEKVTHALRLTGPSGVGYLASFDSWGQAHWPQFADSLNVIPLEPDAYKQVVLAARETLDGIEQLIFLLHPLNENPTGELVTLLNPLAGNHPITGDIDEIKAMMRAYERISRQFPYIDFRYGTRGRKFCWSDAGWLLSLTSESQDSVNHQIQWLTRLLSMRGMPQWHMECYLQMLYEELVHALPARRERYATLVGAVQLLAHERRTSISDEALVALDSAFYAHVGTEWRAWMPNCGGLLASAVADEHAGIAHALTGIEKWMIDPARFPEAWIAAVRDVVSRARVAGA
ncbi:MAG: biliverdin-producing heme oxygenase [Chloroflexales bacterium]